MITDINIELQNFSLNVLILYVLFHPSSTVTSNQLKYIWNTALFM